MVLRIYGLLDLLGHNIVVVLEMFLNIIWRHLVFTLVAGAWRPTDLGVMLNHMLVQRSQDWGWDVATLGAFCFVQGVGGKHPGTQDVQRGFAQLIFEFRGSCCQLL